jgi:hypothetical protein
MATKATNLVNPNAGKNIYLATCQIRLSSNTMMSR